jgi:hypothetical protein
LKHLIFLFFFPAFLQAELNVTGGFLRVEYGTLYESTRTTIQSGSFLTLRFQTALDSPLVTIFSNGTLHGCGTVTGHVENQGKVLANCGENPGLSITGNMSNDHLIRAENQTGFTVSGSFENDGLLDLIFSPSTPPAGITGTGESITPSTIPPLILDPLSLNLELTAYPGHHYRILYTDNLLKNPVIWTEVETFTVSSIETKVTTVSAPASDPRIFSYEITD